MTVIATTQKNELAPFEKVMQGKRLLDALDKVLPKHLDTGRFVRCIMDAAIENPALANCSAVSVYRSTLKAAELGLEVGGALGHAYFIPYGKGEKARCELIIGYKGLLELAARSSRVASIQAEVVYQRENDAGLFRFTRAPFAVAHQGGKPGLREGELVYAYAYAHLVTGGVVGVVLERDEVLKRRPSSVRDDSPWRTHEGRMWRKSALRALLNGGTVPLSPRLQAAMKSNDPEVLDAEVVADEPFWPMGEDDIEGLAALDGAGGEG